MDIRFWGTRGSLAKPGQITLRHGGNTSCVEARDDDGTLIVLDCGTGAHGLGQALLSAGPRCDGHLMITHTHWDHIQGFSHHCSCPATHGTSMPQGRSDASSN
jgi:phosphoribosyl 1,2-cyclic phosphodiesterase